jgi:phenylacetate-CoA ligase
LLSHWWIRAAAGRLATARGSNLLKRYQDHLLCRTVRYAAAHSPFYRKRFEENGLAANMVRRQQDLPRLGFFTTGADLLDDPFAFLAVPRSRVLHVMGTSGSSGKPKLTFYTRTDWERLVGKLRLGYIIIGFDRESVTQTMMCSGTREWMAGDLLHEGLKRYGIWNIPMGTMASPQEQIEAIRMFGSKVLFSTPSYLSRVTEETASRFDLRALAVKGIYVFGEPSSAELRRRIETAWGAKVFDGYGMMEFGAAIAGECPFQNGMHLDLHVITEVIDPQTGRVLERGQEGELVFTSLGRQATPLLRYRSGDIGRLLPAEPCPCRMIPTARLDHVRGRNDQKIFLGTGESFYPEFFERALVPLDGVSAFQIEIDKDGYRDSVRLRIETHSPSAAFAERIVKKVHREIPVLHHEIFVSKTVAEIQVEFLEPGALTRGNQIKLQHLVDKRRV